LKRLSFQYTISIVFEWPVADHAFLLRCLPPSLPGQRILDVCLSLFPCVPYALQRDAFGNLIELGRICAPHDSFTYGVTGSALMDGTPTEPEPLFPVYRFPSAYTRPDCALSEFGRSLPLTGSPAEMSLQLAQAVHGLFTYTPGITGVKTTAARAFSLRQGVCQDYTHVFLALARLRGIPARYVSGLLTGEGSSHAWAEIYDGERWMGVDPTHCRPADDSYIRFNVGRDFDDCAMERGVFHGGASQSQSVASRVTEQ